MHSPNPPIPSPPPDNAMPTGRAGNQAPNVVAEPVDFVIKRKTPEEGMMGECVTGTSGGDDSLQPVVAKCVEHAPCGQVAPWSSSAGKSSSQRGSSALAFANHGSDEQQSLQSPPSQIKCPP